jgi:hypothetical protein
MPAERSRKPLPSTSTRKQPPPTTVEVEVKPEATLGNKPWEPTEDDLKAIEFMASRGMTLSRISAAMGLGATYLTYRKGIKDVIGVAIQDAVERGGALGEKSIASSLFTKAESGDTASQIFFLKSRCGWRENQDLNVFLSTRTKEERDAIVAAAGEE